jgi:BlaI family penicillinase repressor
MSFVFTPRELELMDVLWKDGPCTVSEVRARLGDEVSHNTVATLLSILEKKGRVDHIEDGKAFRYRPIVERDAARRSAMTRLIDTVFGGSSEALITQFIRDRRLTSSEVKRVRDLLDAAAGTSPRGRRRKR